MAATVLIAPSEHLNGLQEQRGLKGAQAFTDSDANMALDVIARERPQLIALEKEFAASRRGMAFVNRLKADPALAATEIRIVFSRRAPRFKVSRETRVIIDGNPASVVDISMVGAQVISATALRPNQRIRMLLDADQSVRFNANVAWASFELPLEGPRYRAGIQFHDANAEMLTRLIEALSEA